MATVTTDQVDMLRTSILGLTSPSITPRRVEVDDVEGPDGRGVLITVQLAGGDAATWDANDFLSIRREARNLALDVFGQDRDVRLVYESFNAPSVEDAESRAEGDEVVDDGNA